MTNRHLIMGAGPVGQAVAHELSARGERVTLASRSGRPGPSGTEALRLEANDAAAVRRAAAGAATIFNCLNPPHYHRWPQEWPPMADALLAAAADTGAVLATASNLYPYGATSHPITTRTPENPAGPKGRERARMWCRVRDAIEAGRVHAVEVRSADYVGAGSFSSLTPAIGGARSGRTAWLLGRDDQPHSVAFVPDVARTLVAAARTPAAWDQLWLTPSPVPGTMRELLDDVAVAAGHGRARVRQIPEAAVRLGGLVSPLMREQREVAPERLRPFTVDASQTTERLGVAATPWPAIVAALAAGD